MTMRSRNPTGFVRRHPGTKSVRWQGIVKYPDWDNPGKWKQRSATFSKKGEAQKWVDAAIAEHRRKPSYQPPPRNVTVGDYLLQWLESSAHRVRKSTLESYRYRIDEVIKILGKKPLIQLQPDDIQKCYMKMAETHSRRTVQYAATLLRGALEQAVNLELLPSNPSRKVPMPRLERTERPVLTPEEARQFLTAAETHRFRVLWKFIALTGVRRGEALALRWEDIDWERRVVTIQRTFSGSGRKRRTINTPKTQRGVRTIAIPELLVKELEAQRKQQQLERQAAGDNWEDTGFVFTTSRGTPFDPSQVTPAFKKLLTKAGLPNTWRLHDLRHAMATHWLASGINPKVVSERLGHASVAFTLQIYAHALPNQQAEAAERAARELLVHDHESDEGVHHRYKV